MNESQSGHAFSDQQITQIIVQGKAGEEHHLLNELRISLVKNVGASSSFGPRRGQGTNTLNPKGRAFWFTKRFGQAEPWHYLFPFGKPTPQDPSKPITDVSGAWKALRKASGVQCRLHDLRHTAATKMAEAGIPESTMLALMGHMSRAMLERYSHIRMAAKRTAMDSLMLNREKGPVGTQNEADSNRGPEPLNSGSIQ